ncbi:hypothetical protein SAMN05192573_101405 [Mucilaginibacter gossypii]|uniref:Uncharacterized protein n=1 Tax=Mucilaginibacter gossypii TaxID=551996 RepID=A0A1G7NZI6_9SPHI|nr:hypothetical protein SAMN05192573_101405 [Mucilaginibacter gossypii]
MTRKLNKSSEICLILTQQHPANLLILKSWFKLRALPQARAIRSYCTGLSHRPVSAPITNADLRVSSE